MIFPKNFEQKIGFNEIRTMLKGRCLSPIGSEMVDKIVFQTNADKINELLEQVREFRRIMEEEDSFPDGNYTDLRSELVRIQLKGSYLLENELFALKTSLSTISDIVVFLNPKENAEEEIGDGEALPEYKYPALQKLTQEVSVFPLVVDKIDRVLNKFGKIKDDTTPELRRVRQDIAETKKSISASLRAILAKAQKDGYAPSDAVPTLRDGRMVIPTIPSVKRKISGIIHDESASGKTVFIEPAEVVEANNNVRTLEAEERRIIIAILQEITDLIRPQVPAILQSYGFLGQLDVIRAKSILADGFDAIEPHVENKQMIDLRRAVHPLLQNSLRKHGKQMTPLDIELSETVQKGTGTKDNASETACHPRILLISGPNAGGKSVCLSTVGLIQYMVQCGLSVPVSETSQFGIFEDLFIDIGDEQSIEDELSTYSGHLFNMKTMMKRANPRSLILIDEMGSGTEPQIGAAIAQAMLHSYLNSGAFGIITTHYQNLKNFAQENLGIINGAMMYDRTQMLPLFRLQIGMPGSSFAIEIARKIGLPEEVIKEASEDVGSDYIQSDKYLQDIVRDKRYWENKRTNIHQKEKRLDDLIGRYEKDLDDLSRKRKTVISDAKEQAASLLKESNAKIENTIRAIREAQAQKEETQKVRLDLQEFKEDVTQQQEDKEDAISRKMEQIRQRRQRREENRLNASQQIGQTGSAPDKTQSKPNDSVEETIQSLSVGDYVTIKGQTSIGRIEQLKGQNAVVAVGSMHLTIKRNRLQQTEPPLAEDKPVVSFLSRSTRDNVSEKKLNFKPDIDVRGMNGTEALNAITYFVEDAILAGVQPLRILHGTGSGYLRQVIRQYLQTIPQVVSVHDERIQLGGAGISIVEMNF